MSNVRHAAGGRRRFAELGAWAGLWVDDARTELSRPAKLAPEPIGRLQIDLIAGRKVVHHRAAEALLEPVDPVAIDLVYLRAGAFSSYLGRGEMRCDRIWDAPEVVALVALR